MNALDPIAELRAIAPKLLEAIASVEASSPSLAFEGERLKQAVQWVTYSSDVMYIFFRRDEVKHFTAAWLIPQIRAYIQKTGGGASAGITDFLPGLSYLFGVAYDLH